MWHRRLACAWTFLAFVLLGTRVADVAHAAVADGALWGAVAGLAIGLGERRGDRRGARRGIRARADRSGVLGAIVDTPPERTIIHL